MSYARWNTGSDVYVYEHCDGGWRTHVASARHVGQTPFPELPPEWWLLPVDEVMAQHKQQQAWYQMATTAPIGLPHDGKDYLDETPGECADRLEWLRAEGYQVPQGAIEALRDEQNTP